MSQSNHPFFNEKQQRIHMILDRFEEALGSTLEPVIEDYLEGQDDIRSELLFELVADRS